MKATITTTKTIRLEGEVIYHPTYLQPGCSEVFYAPTLFAELEQLLNHPAMDTKRYGTDTFFIARFLDENVYSYVRPSGDDLAGTVPLFKLYVNRYHVGIRTNRGWQPDTDGGNLNDDDIWDVCLEVAVTGVRLSATCTKADELL